MAETITLSRHVAAPPERVFQLISDPVEMARWNPAFDHVEWLHGADEPTEGAQFQVHNVDARFDWSFDDCVIVEHDPPRTFAFARVSGTREVATQRYTVEPDGDGSRVLVEYQLQWEPVAERLRGLLRNRAEDVRRALEAALDGLADDAAG